jgi:hypothetical protein
MADSLFERLSKGRTPIDEAPPTEETTKQPYEKHKLIERLLDWLMNRWVGDSVTAFQIRHHGPYPFRPPASSTLAVDIAEELVARGWLMAVKPRRRDSKEWKIARRPASQMTSQVKTYSAQGPARQDPA